MGHVTLLAVGLAEVPLVFQLVERLVDGIRQSLLVLRRGERAVGRVVGLRGDLQAGRAVRT